MLVLSWLASLVASAIGASTLKVLLLPVLVTIGALAIGRVGDRVSDRKRSATLDELSALMQARTNQIVFPDQTEPYRRIEEYVKANRAAEAIFVQYSGEQCKNLVSTVLAAGAKVELYTQLPEAARKIGTSMQANRIAGQFRDSFSNWTGNLTVYQCAPPVSIRVVRIDDKVLCVGFYTFEPEEGRPKYPNDTTAVSGHDRPTFFVQSGTLEYEILNGMVKEMLEIFRNSPRTKRVRP